MKKRKYIQLVLAGSAILFMAIFSVLVDAAAAVRVTNGSSPGSHSLVNQQTQRRQC